MEEDYKAIKCRMELENFTGKSVLSVYQDFHAKVFAKNLVSIMAFHGNEALKKNRKSRKLVYQINFTQYPLVTIKPELLSTAFLYLAPST
ncbi:hypothetical protein ACFL0M_01630 [Thermodesulfobacteriota bacterium]